MNIAEIREMPTVIDNTHESVYRSYQTLELIRSLVLKNTHPQVIGLIIDACYDFHPAPNEGRESHD